MKFTWANISERKILVSNFGMTCNSFREFYTSDWFLHVWALRQDRLRRLHVLKDTTQLSCVRWSSSNRSSFHVMTGVTLDIGCPRSFVTVTTVDNRLPYAFVQTHSSSTWLLHFCHHSFWTFYLVVHQPDDVNTSTFPQTDNHSWSCRTSILDGATLHRMNWCKFLQGNPCMAIETFHHWDSPLGPRVLEAFLSFCCMKEFGDGFDGVIFPRLLISWRKLRLSPLSTLPVGLPIAKNLQDFFVHAVLPPDSWPRRFFHKFHFWCQNSYFVCLARYFFSPSFINLWYSSPIFFWWISKSYSSDTVLSFSDSRILHLYNPSKISSGGIFVMYDKIPSDFESNSWMSSFRRLIVNRSV